MFSRNRGLKLRVTTLIFQGDVTSNDHSTGTMRFPTCGLSNLLIVCKWQMGRFLRHSHTVY